MRSTRQRNRILEANRHTSVDIDFLLSRARARGLAQGISTRPNSVGPSLLAHSKWSDTKGKARADAVNGTLANF